MDEKKKYRYPYNVVLEVTGINSEKNSKIGDFEKDVEVTIAREKCIIQD